jgi:hypothetical protein
MSYDPEKEICCANDHTSPLVGGAKTECCGLEAIDPTKSICCGHDVSFRGIKYFQHHKSSDVVIFSGPSGSLILILDYVRVFQIEWSGDRPILRKMLSRLSHVIGLSTDPDMA